jgi:hypothetical protein
LTREKTIFRKLFDAERDLDAVWVAPRPQPVPGAIRALETGAVVNTPKAEAWICRDPRKGWELGYV